MMEYYIVVKYLHLTFSCSKFLWSWLCVFIFKNGVVVKWEYCWKYPVCGCNTWQRFLGTQKSQSPPQQHLVVPRTLATSRTKQRTTGTRYCIQRGRGSSRLLQSTVGSVDLNDSKMSQDCFRGWGNDSAAKVPAEQTRRPEFAPPVPT